MNSGSPRFLRRLVSWILPRGPVRDGLLGDLDELYAERVRRGRASANLWYARQVLSAALHYALRGLVRTRRRGFARRLMDGITRDVAHAIRMLRRRLGFTSVVVLTLALGIGANTAVLSVVRSVLLRPLSFPEDERLAVVSVDAPSFNFEDFPSSPPEYVAYRDNTRSWEQLAAYKVRAATIAGAGDEPERLNVVFATWNLFSALGTEPLLGRSFTVDEDNKGSDAVAVISHSFWMRHYGGDPGVIGRTVRLDGVARTVVGVMPAGFRFPTSEVHVWQPLAITPGELENRGDHGLSIVGRLKQGMTVASAESELAALIPRLNEAGGNLHTWHPAHVRTLRTEMVGDVSWTLWVVLGAAALVLVIACANVANLLLVRAEERVREMSVRTALGAGPSQLAAQLLAESLVMAGAGGLAGVALAYLGVEALRGIAPADLPRLDEIAIDANVLVFTIVVTTLAGVIFGLVPALHSGGPEIQEVLREEGRNGTASRNRIRVRQFLVVSQTALAVVLLVAAGLLLQSFRQLVSVDPGFRPDGVLTASITVPPTKYAEAEDVVGFYESLLPRIASLPGVVTAGAVYRAPLGGALRPGDIEVEGWVNPADAARPIADVQAVTPGYFEAMAIPMREGRAFEEGDRLTAPAVAIVSESLARAYWPGKSALGGRIRLDAGDAAFAHVVGVVPDVHQEGLDRPAARGTLYLVHAQTPRTWTVPPSMTLTVRTAIEPASLVNAIRTEVHTLDPSVPLYRVRTMDQAVVAVTATHRFSMLLQLLFALVALALAAVGLYGVLAFTVARRTAEIGIRMALGAERSEVQRMVLGQGMRIVGMALALGVVAAVPAGRLLASLLFNVSTFDVVTYTTVIAVLIVVGMLACWIPARRASGVDPALALRAD